MVRRFLRLSCCIDGLSILTTLSLLWIFFMDSVPLAEKMLRCASFLGVTYMKVARLELTRMESHNNGMLTFPMHALFADCIVGARCLYLVDVLLTLYFYKLNWSPTALSPFKVLALAN